MDQIEHKSLSLNGLNIHVAEAGRGPLVLFLHGFPQCWYTWRRQLAFFAARGFHAVAPDLRGYADTTGAPPSRWEKFTVLHAVGDVAALIDAAAPAPGEKALVVGHDWGALVAWALCLYRPDKVRAVVNMSVFYTPRSPVIEPVERFRRLYGDEYYIIRFQEPGQIEHEFAQIGTKNVLKNFLTYHKPTPLFLPMDKPFPNTPITLPSWLSEEDVDYYASKFDAAGFTGALNYYRALDINWELTAPWTGSKIQVPVKFLIGDLEPAYNAPGAKDYVHKGGFKENCPLLEEVVVMEGVGHFIQEEKPNEVNQHILSFFKNYS